ncbi:MAG: YoaK family protein [Thermoanaerobaculia bacterium]
MSASRTTTRLSGATKAWIAVALTWVSGFVDAVCYVTLFRVFVANMSGNSVAIGIGIGEGRWNLLFRRGFAVPLFFAGLVICRLAVDWANQQKIRRIFGWIFAVEAGLLGLFVAVGWGFVEGKRMTGISDARYFTLIALPAVAMGLQNAALTHFGPLTVRTTHVTGTLAKLADHVARWLLWMRKRIRSAEGRRGLMRESVRHGSFRTASLLFAAWCGYVIGAATGAWLKTLIELSSLLVPIAILIALVAIDWIDPFAVGRGEGEASRIEYRGSSIEDRVSRIEDRGSERRGSE